MNTGAPSEEAWVLAWQTKLHRWSVEDKERTYDDIHNLVTDRRTLREAWQHVRANKGSQSAGVDGLTRHQIEKGVGEEAFLEQVREGLKTGTYQPAPVREKGIRKENGKMRYLGIPTIGDRVVQQAMRMVLEPIFEADFNPKSYAYRPGRRSQDAIQEIHHLIRPYIGYEWVVEGDIRACFDNVHHGVLLEEVRKRVRDRRILHWIRIQLEAGIITEQGQYRQSITGTPQGGILSPLLANIYLSRLDRHFQAKWKRFSKQRTRQRQKGQGTCSLVRFADDFVILVKGTRENAESLKQEAADLLKRDMKMELSWEKTRVTHVREGFDFLGQHLIVSAWSGGGRIGMLMYPSKKSLLRVQEKVKKITSRSTLRLSLGEMLTQLNQVLRGWCYYFRFANSKRTFDYLGYYVWRRVYRWMRKKHPKLTAKMLRRRFFPNWEFQDGEITLFRADKVRVMRYGYRGTQIPTPWNGLGALLTKIRRGDRLPEEPSLLDSLEEYCAI